ncbi:anthranilate phosphoribosyltransferase [Dehalococcoidia bacterium]|nr:anthranilate phosphoribosyltransferase [Dehalococcoidia bacterium]
MFDDKLKFFGSRIAALIAGKDLTRDEAKEMFCQVLLNEQPDLQQGAFLVALTAKGETAEEIAGAWEAIYELDTEKVSPIVPGPLVENCGTGMDSFKTFNISTAAAIVAAGGGIYLAKHGARALTSTCGAIDILEAVGVDVECDLDIVKQSIEKVGIGIFNGMSPKVHPQALFRILSQIHFGTTLNIAGSLANPAQPRYGVRGVHSKELVEPVARAMRDIGYIKALVVHGGNGDGMKGMDEISTLGETVIAEVDSGEITTFTIRPEDFGIQRSSEHAIRPFANRKEEALEFLRILTGYDRGSRHEITCLNTAPVFYLIGQAKDLREGFILAQEIIQSGRAIAKLREWVMAQNSDPEGGLRKLDCLLEEIDAGRM